MTDPVVDVPITPKMLDDDRPLTWMQVAPPALREAFTPKPLSHFRLTGIIPAPQGSKRAVRRGDKTVLVEMSKKLPVWRDAVQQAAYLTGHHHDIPVRVELRFYMPRPQKPKWWVPAVTPDLDKLVRSTLDGLVKGGLLKDDALVVSVVASKVYAEAPTEVGVSVNVWEVTE